MAVFSVEIDTNNEAFGNDDGVKRFEIARILREIAQRIEQDDATPFILRDLNNNPVGSCTGGE